MRLRVAAASGVALVAAVLTAPAAPAITGGHESPEPYSFMGSFQRPDSPRPDKHVCGATLIAPRWAVTAGHCVRNEAGDLTGYPNDWKVRFGSVSTTSGGELIEVEKFFQHPGGLSQDIGLLKLKTPAEGEPVKIAEATPPETPARIMGWGVTCDEDRPECFPKRLREADTKIQPNDACAKSGIVETQICVGARDGSIAATNMDSGGPALVRDGDGWALAGAVSGANGSGQPVVYTSVPAFRSWLSDMMDERKPSLDGAVSVNRCSGSIVRTSTTKPEDPALLLTNGHCTSGERPAPGDAVVNRPESIPVGVFNAQGKPQTTAKTTKLVYATMTGTDVGLYQLDKTYAQLAAENVKVFELSGTAPSQADSIDVISGGLQDTWSCAVGSVVPELREQGYVQHQAIRYTEDCSPDAGASGSPLVDRNTGAVVGIHNTSNTNGGVCTANNPCEVDESGQVTIHIGQAYAQQTAALPACLTERSEVDLAKPDCTLTKPAA